MKIDKITSWKWRFSNYCNKRNKNIKKYFSSKCCSIKRCYYKTRYLLFLLLGQNISERDDVYLVFEYCDGDLSGLMNYYRKNNLEWFSEDQIKCYIHQLLISLDFLQTKKIMHRDLKCSNILINCNNVVKLGDFGLSRTPGYDREYTNKVITLWYRPPELLIGCYKYSYEVDMWSLGCIIAELIIGKALFDKPKELEQLLYITSICGTPNEWPNGWKKYKFSSFLQDIKLNEPRKLKEKLISIGQSKFGDSYNIPEDVFDLIDKLLVINPEERLSAKDALLHKWFNDVKSPSDVPLLPILNDGFHEYKYKKDKINASKNIKKK